MNENENRFISGVKSNKNKVVGKSMQWLMSTAGIGIALVIMILIFAILNPKFISLVNVMNILVQISINLVISAGMTVVILLGGIDLSVGSVLALCTVVAGKILTNPTLPLGLAILFCCLSSLLVGVGCGLFNGFVSQRWGLHPFIVTLGMMNIARGAALKITGANTIYNFPMTFVKIGTRNILGVPSIFLIALTVTLLLIFVLSKTVYGRFIYAIGNNEEAVRLSGHNTKVKKVIAFVICGGTVGVAAILYMLRLNIASPILGYNFELYAIAATILGGTSLFGGKGSLTGTFFGVCIIGVLNNGLLLVGMDDFVRQIVTGLIIVAAVILDTYRSKFLD
jgi:ribose transport system permease protein